MEIIDSVAALDAVTDEILRPILDRYRGMMDLAVIYIVQPGDTLDTLQQARGWPFECWEFIVRHTTGCYEAVFVISDDGAGHVVLVPDAPVIDGDLLRLLGANAVPADRSEAANR